MARRRAKPVKVSHQELLRQRRLPMPRPTEAIPSPKTKSKRRRPIGLTGYTDDGPRWYHEPSFDGNGNPVEDRS